MSSVTLAKSNVAWHLADRWTPVVHTANGIARILPYNYAHGCRP
jgi:hypothetical protein